MGPSSLGRGRISTLRPNILLISTDQQRADALGLSGNSAIRTPNLDALGRSGAYFPAAYSPMPVCVPARYLLMTGRLPVSWGMHSNCGEIPAGVPTLPEILGHEGYRTALIGKAHFSGPPDECQRLGIPPYRYPYGFHEMLISEEGRQWNRGGDDYQAYLERVGWSGYERAHGVGNNDARTSPSPLPQEHYPTAWCARESDNWIRRHRADRPHQPFFLWTSFVKPHAPYDPPEPWDRMYSPRDMPEPVGGAVDLQGLSPWYLEKRYGHHIDSLSPEAIRRARAYYYGQVSQIDFEIGRLVGTLRELGIERDTIILFCSDHGDLLGDHGLFFKANFFQGSWHVPMLLAAPGRVEPGRVHPRLVTLADVFPTLLQLAGVQVPAGVHGSSLLSEHAGAEIVFGTLHPSPERLFAARTARWQYVLHEAGGFEELYDLTADPGERCNAANEPVYQDVKAKMRSHLTQWLQRIDPTALAGSDIRTRPWCRPSPQPARTPLGLRPH